MVSNAAQDAILSAANITNPVKEKFGDEFGLTKKKVLMF